MCLGAERQHDAVAGRPNDVFVVLYLKKKIEKKNIGGKQSDGTSFFASAEIFAAAGSIMVTGTGCTRNILCDPFLQAFILRQEVLQGPVASCRRAFLCYSFFFFGD